MALTVRLGPKAERALNALAKRRRQTRSDIVREAIEQFASSDETPGERRPYAAWADVIGVIRVGQRDARKTTGAQFTEIARSKARARRAR